MYHRILVPLDGSPLAEVALEQLGHLAGPETEVLLLRVAEPVTDLPPVALAPNPPSGGFAAVAPPGGRGSDMPDQVDDRAVREAQQYLDDKVDALRGVVSKRRTLVLEDTDPASAIAAQARDEPADLILMATHGRSGVARRILGSVAEKVLHSSHIPLLLVRPGKPAQ
jgi:nucleotide-binding universal stress UspA family protein